MSDQENNSGSGGSGGSGEDDAPILYACRKCPGVMFSAAEMESHRAFHRNTRGSRLTRSGRTNRASSSVTSDGSGSLFTPVERSEEATTSRKQPALQPRAKKRPALSAKFTSGMRPKPAKQSKPKPGPKSSKVPEAKGEKIKSAKRYDRGVKIPANNGG